MRTKLDWVSDNLIFWLRTNKFQADPEVERTLKTCQDMINNEASFKTVVSFLKMAKEIYGKDRLVEGMNTYCYTQLISLLDFE